MIKKILAITALLLAPLTAIAAPYMIGSGGTGTSTFATYSIPYVKTASQMSEIKIGTAGLCLKVNSGATGYEFGTCGSGGSFTTTTINGLATTTFDFTTSSDTIS